MIHMCQSRESVKVKPLASGLACGRCQIHVRIKLGASKETLLQSLKLPFHRLQVGATVVTGEGNGNPLQYSRLENPMVRGAWWVIVHMVAKSQT